jgi:hypothetical protein
MATETTTETNKKNYPEYSIVQANRDKDGKTSYTSVGAVWQLQKSKNGKEFANLNIGSLKLLMFKYIPKTDKETTIIEPE